VGEAEQLGNVMRVGEIAAVDPASHGGSGHPQNWSGASDRPSCSALLSCFSCLGYVPAADMSAAAEAKLELRSSARVLRDVRLDPTPAEASPDIASGRRARCWRVTDQRAQPRRGRQPSHRYPRACP
jgi:hypothetical protein